MSRLKMQKPSKVDKKAPVLLLEKPHSSPAGGKRWIATVLVIITLLSAAIAGVFYFMPPPQALSPTAVKPETASSPLAPKDYVGANACIECHKGEFAA